MTQYNKLKTDFDKPDFAYILFTTTGENKRSAFLPDYYLYKEDEFPKAYYQLKAEHASGVTYTHLCDVVCNQDGYRVRKCYEGTPDDVIFVDEKTPLLHCKWYTKVGQWLNPRFDI